MFAAVVQLGGHGTMARDASMEVAERVLVTGCCGYIGAWTTHALLRAGFDVRGTSREPEYARRLHEEVFARNEASDSERERLEIVHAELLEADSWTGLADGCSVVVHIACPVMTDAGAPRHAMFEPAVAGTENVVREAARAGGVRRFVQLSSIVTLLDHHRPASAGVGDERVGPQSWNETANPDRDPYAHAKVIGERRARALVGELLPNADFASVLPGPVIGPPIAGDRVAASIDKTMAPLLGGQLKTGSVDLWLGVVDVRDVAAACAAVVALPAERLVELGARSRFICVAQPVNRLQQLADMIRADFPEYSRILPKSALPLPNWLLLAVMRFMVTPEAYSYTRAMLGRNVAYDTSLSEAVLGMRWHDARQSVFDTVRWLRERGHYPPAQR
jgi:dihydroflavonol-4-reductase